MSRKTLKKQNSLVPSDSLGYTSLARQKHRTDVYGPVQDLGAVNHSNLASAVPSPQHCQGLVLLKLFSFYLRDRLLGSHLHLGSLFLSFSGKVN